ncbi:MAG: DUF3048 domain-containing protein [Acidimicrobiales bacterium]
MKTIVAILAFIVALGLFAGACGGGGGETASPATPTADPTPTATTGGGGTPVGGDDAATDPDDPSATPGPDPAPEFVSVLTGLGVDEAVLSRPAVVVKVDNSEDARPQIGFNQADVVVEIIVEGITRLAGVFQSSDIDIVGPARSARASDPDIVANFGRPLMAFSGANDGVLGIIRQAAAEGKLVDARWDAVPGAYFRQGPNVAPHNLYVNIDSLRTELGAGAGTPPAMFSFRAPGESGSGTPSAGVSIVYTGGLDVSYAWDDALGGWARFQRGTAHTDADGVQAAPSNVVILFTEYLFGGGSPQAISTGEGEAWVLTDGGIVRGRWSRPDPAAPWQIVDDAGAPIGLTPGTTWLALPRPGEAVEMTPAEADALLATR